MQRILAAVLAISASLATLYAQSPGQLTQGPGNTAGLLYASNFGQWKIQGNSSFSWSGPTGCAVTADGMTLNPVFKVGTPVQIVDANPALNEVVTPTAVSFSGSGCAISVTPAHKHYSFYITSATAGLQESINWAAGLPYSIIVTPDWSRLGGITSTITSAQGNTNAWILDERVTGLACYSWNGSAYVNSNCASGGSGNVTSVGLSMPSIFAVSGSPVTGAGTLAATLNTQNANTVFAGPASGSPATPAFRTLQLTDLPQAACPVDTPLWSFYSNSCVAGGTSGLTSLNGLTGPALNLTSSDSSVTITPSGTSIDLQAVGGGSGGTGANQWLFEAGKNGATCDGVTDDTTALNNLLTTVYTAGGGEILVQGTCLISGQINVPNNGAMTNPTQPTIRITGDSGGSANGAWITPPATSGTLDMRYNATYGKILTLGQGKLEIDHLTLKDGGTDCSQFIYTTNTTLSIHDNLFSGTASGSSACNDGIILGGTTTTIATLDPTDAFQGYHTYIDHNFFDKMRRVAWLRKFADAITFTHNTISKNCGATASEAAVELGVGNAQDARGNYFSGNLYEIEFYPYPIWLNGGSGNTFFGDNFWDANGTTNYLFHVTAGGQGNVGIVYYDSSLTESKVSDDNQPGGSNSFIGYYGMGWGLGRAVVNNQVCAGSGSGTSGTCSSTVTFTPVSGTMIRYQVPSANTGASYQITVNGFGPKPVAKWQNVTTLAAGDLQAGAVVPMIYDGTKWELGLVGNPPTAAFSGGLGSSYQDATETATPANPSAGNDRLYLNSTSHQLSCLTSTGGNCMPTTSGSITLENGGSSLGPVTTLNCSSGTTCSASGGVGTITATSSSAFPFTVAQESFGAGTTATSWTFTYHQAAAASGNTEFLVVATGGTTITTPTGWTLDADYSPGLHVAVFHRASAGESSVSIAVGVSTQISVYYVELAGTRTFDTDVTFNNAPVPNGLLNYGVVNTSSITPTAGAWVIGATVYLTADTNTNSPTAEQPADPAWKVRLAPRPGSSGVKGLIIESSNMAASGSAVTPPSIDIYSGTLSNGNNPCTILFSIK